MKKKRLERFGPVETQDNATNNNTSQVTQDFTPQQNVAPQMQREQSKAESAQSLPKAHNPANAKQIRCKHFPDCKKAAEECAFHHPTEECKFFPKCTYGEKCMYLHPEVQCKFGDNCNRMNCSYKHSKHRQQMMQFNPLMLMQQMQMPMMRSQYQKNYQQ